MSSMSLDHRAEALRAFNRFYTRRMHLLTEGLLDSPLSLTEARVLFELAQQNSTTAVEVRAKLELDAGYLSRIVKSFIKNGLLESTASKEDRRQQQLSLTKKGRELFKTLDKASHEDAKKLLSTMPRAEQARLIEATETIEKALDPEPKP